MEIAQVIFQKRHVFIGYMAEAKNIGESPDSIAGQKSERDE
jgi:hypothetical protein